MATHLSSAKNMFLVKMFIPRIPFLPSRAATARVSFGKKRMKSFSCYEQLTSMISVEILLKGSTLQSSKAIRRESTGENAHTIFDIQLIDND